MRLKSSKSEASFSPKSQVIFLGLTYKDMIKQNKIFSLDAHFLIFETGEVMVNYD